MNSAYALWHARAEVGLPYLPLSRILGIQGRRARSMVRHAYDTVPYYREIMDSAGIEPSDIRTAGDLSMLPILESEQIARDPDRFRSKCVPDCLVVKLHTAGTSGYSKHVAYDPKAALLALAHGHRQRVVCAHFIGGRFGYREMQVDRKGGVSDRLRRFYDENTWVPSGVDLHRRTLDPSGSFDENIRDINRFQPDAIGGVGSYIGALYRHAEERGTRLHRPKLVRYGGTVMPEADRSLLENELKVPVLSLYQAVEALRIGFQCERRKGLHLHLDSLAVRVVDRNGQDLKPGGTGDLVISNLVNRATVLLNYRLGDVVTLGRTTCTCGRTLPTLEKITGRTEELIHLPEGRKMYANSVITACNAVPGFVQAQLIQEELKRFTLRVVFKRGVEWKKACSVLESEVRGILGEEVQLSIERLNAIPMGRRGKVHALISRLPKPARNGTGGP